MPHRVIAHRLRHGALEDAEFDVLFPRPLQAVSRRFWTPVGVARRAAKILRARGVRRVLDVGSGVGKFVLVAATAAPEIEFIGVEQRSHLVDVANRVRGLLGVDNAHFVSGDATELSWGGFSGVYLYNPFAECLFSRAAPLDDTVELGRKRFIRDALRTEHR